MIAPWQIYQGPPFEKSKLLQIVRHGPDLSADRNWWGQVLWGLEQRGLRPGRVALDWETGVGYWDLRGPNQGDVTLQLAPVWQDAEAFARLPEAVRVYEPAEFDWKTNRHAVIAWTQYAAEVRADALREVFVEPLHAVFPGVPVSNYRDARHSGALKDSNGWPFPQAGVGLESSPPLYRKSAEENLQMLRAVADAGGPPPVPWVSYPSYVGRDVWEATIRGAYALGVREFLYWNPAEEDKAQGDDTFAAGIFRLLRVAEGAAFD